MAEKKPKKAPAAQSTQLTIFSGRETPDAYRKAVEVLHSTPWGALTVVQRRMLNALLKNALETGVDNDGYFRVSLMQLEEDIGYSSNNRQHLKDNAKALMHMVFDWDVLAPAGKRAPWEASVLFPEVELHREYMRYQVSAKMRDRVLNPSVYALIDMKVVRRLRRSASIALWEFCVRFERIGHTGDVPWTKVRDSILGESTESKTYAEYKYFKSKVLNVAIKEINAESRHTIEMVEKKIGRTVDALRFTVKRKEPEIGDDAPDDDRYVELLSELVNAIGLPQSEARKLLKQNSFDEIRAAIDYTKRRASDKKLKPLTSKPAYFRQALEQRYAGEPQAAPSPSAKPAAPQVDIRVAYAVQRSQDAETYFQELDAADQDALVQRYNEQQSAASLRIKAKAGKTARTAFFAWLAVDTWGEPEPEELLAFAQKLLGQIKQ